MIHRLEKDKKLYLATSIFWVLLSLFTVFKAGAFRTNESETVYWAHLFSYTFTSGLTWAVFMIPIYTLVRQLSLDKYKWTRLIGYHLILAMVVSASQRLLSMSLDYLIQRGFKLVPNFPDYSEYFSGHFLRRFTEGLLWYGLIVAVLYGYSLYVDSRNKGNSLSVDNSRNSEILIKRSGYIHKIQLKDIYHVKANGNYVRIFTQQEEYKYRSSMKKMAELLGDSFYRVHNSHIVNVEYLKGAEHVYNGEYLLHISASNVRIPTSNSFKENLKELIGVLDSKNDPF